MKTLLYLLVTLFCSSCIPTHSSDNYTSSIIVLTDGTSLTAKSYTIEGESMTVVLSHPPDTIIVSMEDVVDYGKPVQ